MKTRTKWLLGCGGVLAGLVVLIGGATVAFLLFRTVTGWGTVRVPEESLSYPDLLAAVQQLAPVDGLLVTSQPRLLCGGDVFMCSNAVLFEFSMPDADDAKDACDVAYRQLRRIGEGPIVVLGDTDTASEERDSFMGQCVVGVQGAGSSFDVAGKTSLFGESSIWMTLEAPYSAASPDVGAYSGRITMYNQLPTFARMSRLSGEKG